MKKFLISPSIRFSRFANKLSPNFSSIVFALFAASTTAGLFAQSAPQVDFVVPEDGATGVSTNSSIVITFNVAMDTSIDPTPSFPPYLVGSYLIEPAEVATAFFPEWGDDEKSLILTPIPNFPISPGTTITWTLNPAGTTAPLKNSSGVALAEDVWTGSYTADGEGSGGNDEECDPVEDGLGEYGIFKSFGHEQISASEIIPLEDEEAFFGAFVEAPDDGPAVTSASVAIPMAGIQPLDETFSIFAFYSQLPDEATANSVIPPGNYVLTFKQEGLSERDVSMTMPNTFSTVPRITNYAAAQAIDSTQGFTLKWVAFSAQGIEQRIAITITDTDPFSFENIVFTAPNECIPRELLPTATSIEIPAGFLQPSKTYSGELEFSDGFYLSETAVLDMSGFGAISRRTVFEIKTLPEGGEVIPATFSNFDLIEGKPTFLVTGSPSETYTIYRSSAVGLPFNSWENMGTLTTDDAGLAPFVDTDSGLTFPAFYQAVGGN